jgi:hypothetical protein
MKKVLLLQTCDGVVYKPMLDLTESHHKNYCNKHGYDYRRYDGVIFGKFPWCSTFNRIFLLKKILEENKYDWVLYIDADAVIVDLEKNLDEFILDDSKALVACRGTSDNPLVFSDINIGVCFYNMRHQFMPFIIQDWLNLVNLIPKDWNELDEDFQLGKNKYDDQFMLCNIIQQRMDSHDVTVYRGEDRDKFNYQGPFIQQVLRVDVNGVKNRCERIEQLI